MDALNHKQEEHTLHEVMDALAGLYDLLGFLIYKTTGEQVSVRLPMRGKILPMPGNVTVERRDPSDKAGTAIPPGQPCQVPPKP